jgi:hypothetical protein
MLAIAPLAMGIFAAAPAFGLEHQVTLESSAGPIAADYKGAVQIETKTVGTANIPGRTNTQFCRYTISLEVEREASVGEDFEARRTLVRDDVLTGSLPGRCDANMAWVNSRVEAGRDRLQTALMELVDQDKQLLLAEANSNVTRTRGG